MYGAGVVFAEELVFEGVAVCDVAMRSAVELVGVLTGEATRCEVVELVGGVWRGSVECPEVEWSVAKGGVRRGYVGFLSEGNSAEAGAATGTQFGCCRISCPWVAFIDSWGRRL